METDPIKQIAIFRVPELQLCLQQLQLSKSGLKSILQTRLSNHLRSVIANTEQAAPTDRLQQKKSFAGALFGAHLIALRIVREHCPARTTWLRWYCLPRHMRLLYC